MFAFNEFAARSELRELHRGGSQYTWTDKQLNPIMVALDRVFMNSSWEDHFPLVIAQSITRVGSDHNPLIVEVENSRGVKSKIFRFESAWLQQKGFREWVSAKWPDQQNQKSIDYWQSIATKPRRSLRGWNRNWGSDMKKRKQDLIILIKDLDHKAEEVGLEDAEWKQRYSWEEEIVDIYHRESERKGSERRSKVAA